MPSDISFGHVLRQRRKELDLTQEALAHQVGCSIVSIRRFEANIRRPSKHTAEKIAQHLNLSQEERASFVRLARLNASVDTLSIEPVSADSVVYYPPMQQPDYQLETLPHPLTAVIGRNEEAETVYRLLSTDVVRLVTLVGPPGVGKTRLALHVTSQLRDSFADGVYFVALDDVHDPSRLIAVMCARFGVPCDDEQQAFTALTKVIDNKQILLLLDTCEHVVAAAPLLASLLMACPQLKLLTSSRIAWRVRGEHVVYVGPLALPDTSFPLTWHAITQSPAVALFVERASAVRSDFKLTNENTTAVLELCTRLDGLPLAIELAASCMTVLSPNTLLEQLIAGRQPLRFLTCGPRDLPPRQQSLSAAIEWGYQLLQHHEQALFRRLGVFVGGGTFEAIVAVCEDIDGKSIALETGQSQCGGVSMLSILSSLVDNNLVLQRTYSDGHVRFSMLQIIREYAYERLTCTADVTQFQERYTRYYVNAIEAMAHQQASADQAFWLDYMERELDNIRESLRWALDTSRNDLALRIGRAIWRFWLIRGHIYEGYDWLEQVLKCSDVETSSIRAEAHYGAGMLALLRHDFSQALAHSSIYLALQQEEAQSEGIARAYTQLGLIAYWQGDFKTAFSILQQNSTLLDRFEGSDGKAEALQTLALTLLAQQEHEVMSQWSAYHHEEHWRQRHTHRSVAPINWGELFLSMPINEQVVAYLEQSLALYQQTQHTHGIAHTLSLLARVSLRKGDIVQSIEYLQPGIRLFWALRDRLGLATAFVTCAELMTVTQREEQGAYFLSVAASIYDAVGIAPSSIERTRQDVLNRAVRARLSYPVWKTMWHRGRATALNHVVVEALNGMDIGTHTYRMYTMQEKQLGGNP